MFSFGRNSARGLMPLARRSVLHDNSALLATTSTTTTTTTTTAVTFTTGRLAMVQPRANNHFFSYGNLGLAVLRRKDNPDFHHDPGHDTEVWKSEELFGPGMKEESIPSQFEQATGKERIEYMSLVEGKDPYHGLMEPLTIQEKGTKAKPIQVLSPDEDRIIGCQGYPGAHHAASWFLVTEDGHKHWHVGHNRCQDCGNTFKLKRIEIPYPTIN